MISNILMIVLALGWCIFLLYASIKNLKKAILQKEIYTRDLGKFGIYYTTYSYNQDKIRFVISFIIDILILIFSLTGLYYIIPYLKNFFI